MGGQEVAIFFPKDSCKILPKEIMGAHNLILPYSQILYLRKLFNKKKISDKKNVQIQQSSVAMMSSWLLASNLTRDTIVRSPLPLHLQRKSREVLSYKEHSASLTSMNIQIQQTC